MAASHPSDEARASRNTSIDTSDYELQINAFSNVERESEDDSDDNNDDDPELLKAIEDEVKSRRNIERAEKMWRESEGWTEVHGTKSRVVATTRGRPLTEAYLIPFSNLESDPPTELEAPEPVPNTAGPVENLVERMQPRLEAAAISSTAFPGASLSGI